MRTDAAVGSGALLLALVPPAAGASTVEPITLDHADADIAIIDVDGGAGNDALTVTGSAAADGTITVEIEGVTTVLPPIVLLHAGSTPARASCSPVLDVEFERCS